MSQIVVFKGGAFVYSWDVKPMWIMPKRGLVGLHVLMNKNISQRTYVTQMDPGSVM